MSLEAEVATLTAAVQALREQLVVHHAALMSVVTGQPGRTQAEIAAETNAGNSEKKGPGRPKKEQPAPQPAPATQAAASQPAAAPAAAEEDFDPFGETP